MLSVDDITDWPVVYWHMRSYRLDPECQEASVSHLPPARLEEEPSLTQRGVQATICRTPTATAPRGSPPAAETRLKRARAVFGTTTTFLTVIEGAIRQLPLVFQGATGRRRLGRRPRSANSSRSAGQRNRTSRWRRSPRTRPGC